MDYYSVNDGLIKAIRDNDTDLANSLMKEDLFDPNHVNHDWEASPLSAAADIDNVDMLKALIDKGADVNQWPEPLCSAASWGHTNSMLYLLERGADIHANGEAALVTAVLHRQGITDNQNVSEGIEALISKGANVEVAIASLDEHTKQMKMKPVDDETKQWMRDTASTVNLKDKIEASLNQKDEFKNIMQGLGKHTAQQQSTKKMKL